MSSSRDSYARLPFRADRARRADESGGGLTFLDIADRTANVEALAGYLREVPLDIVGRTEWVLARWGPEHQGWPPADEAADALQERLDEMGSNAKLGIVVFRIGTKPSVSWSSRASHATPIHQVLLARARAAEVEAFLRWGHAIWHPETYHYMLPSGKHTDIFVRLADVFQDMRAASALATWLYEALSDDAPSTLVMDIGTLMPLVSELRLAADRHRETSATSSAAVGTVVALDRYPSNSLGIQRSLLTTSPESPILGLVSVTDSGSFAERLLNAFSSLGAPAVRIEQLISRRAAGAISLPATGRRHNSIEDPWLSVALSDDILPDHDTCISCRNPRRARLVRINPRAMSAMVLPEPDLLVPDIFDARRNASLWDFYRTTGTDEDPLSLLGPTGTRSEPEAVRVTKEAIFFEPTHLLKSSPSEFISRRLDEFQDFPKRNRNDSLRSMILDTLDLVRGDSSIVVYNSQEAAQFSDIEWRDLRLALSEHNFVSEEALWTSYSVVEGLATASDVLESEPRSVLILSLGSLTGLSCQRMFLAGRQQWPHADFRGLVVHAHPEDARVWTSMRNTFTDSGGNRRLLALWLTYLPSWSPLAVERDTYLVAQRQGLNTVELTARLSELENSLPPSCALLGREDPSLQPHSYFGQSLGARETLCAVGSAMEAARIQARPRGAPYWMQFDLRRILRSYFDGLIHAAVLRWCEPHEAWWGPKSQDCCDFLFELEHADFDFTLLLPELLLACAEEKLPLDATAQLVTTAQLRIVDEPDERTRNHLRLGVDLCKLALDDQGSG